MSMFQLIKDLLAHSVATNEEGTSFVVDSTISLPTQARKPQHSDLGAAIAPKPETESFPLTEDQKAKVKYAFSCLMGWKESPKVEIGVTCGKKLNFSQELNVSSVESKGKPCARFSLDEMRACLIEQDPTNKSAMAALQGKGYWFAHLAQSQTHTCPKCSGSGTYQLNSGRVGDCFRCSGTGKVENYEFLGWSVVYDGKKVYLMTDSGARNAARRVYHATKKG